MNRTFATVVALATVVGCGGETKATTGHTDHTMPMTTTTTTTGTTSNPTTGPTTTTTTTGGMTGFDLTFEGTGYNPHDGQDIWFVLKEAGTYTQVGTLRTTMTDGAGNINETWAGVLQPGVSYALFWVADLDGDGACTPPGGDHGRSVPISAVSGDVVLQETHNTNFDPNVCDHVIP